jgi:hypothetical protein
MIRISFKVINVMSQNIVSKQNKKEAKIVIIICKSIITMCIAKSENAYTIHNEFGIHPSFTPSKQLPSLG